MFHTDVMWLRLACGLSSLNFESGSLAHLHTKRTLHQLAWPCCHGEGNHTSLTCMHLPQRTLHQVAVPRGVAPRTPVSATDATIMDADDDDDDAADVGDADGAHTEVLDVEDDDEETTDSRGYGDSNVEVTYNANGGSNSDEVRVLDASDKAALLIGERPFLPLLFITHTKVSAYACEHAHSNSPLFMEISCTFSYA